MVPPAMVVVVIATVMVVMQPPMMMVEVVPIMMVEVMMVVPPAMMVMAVSDRLCKPGPRIERCRRQRRGLRGQAHGREREDAANDRGKSISFHRFSLRGSSSASTRR